MPLVSSPTSPASEVSRSRRFGRSDKTLSGSLDMSDAPMRSCFVMMGFGEKTDFYSNPQRVLNLNRTYDSIIKPAVEEAGLECIRADEIIHSTVIDKPMYEWIHKADLVIADL